MATLLAIRGPHTGVRLELKDDAPTTLGRSPECAVALLDSQVSRVHAEIRRQGQTWIVHDRGSRNGVLVNGERVNGDRVLLRNDEVQLGASLFLFDSDFDLQNATFSDKSVYLSAPHEDTVEAPPVATLLPAQLPAAMRAEQESLSLLQQVGEVLAPGIGPMAEAIPRILKRLGSLWSADSALLLLWDPITGQLRPVAAEAPEEQVAVHAGTIRQVFQTQKALLTSDMAVDYRYAMGGRPPEAGRRSILCAPLMVGPQPIGVIHIERRIADAYSLKDLRLFQAVANLLGVVIEQMQRLESQPLLARPDTGRGAGTLELIGKSPAFQQALAIAQRVAVHPTTVLLIGETGTGKEVFAQEIHRLSPQGKHNGPFVALNCAAIPPELFESELFGHERGSFTGADRLNRGKIEMAHGGTLFLDEIGELALNVQPKLLRFLQEKVFYRVGGNRPLRVEARLIAATNVDLEQAVKQGRFREDLYHRVSVIPILVPPLRDRRPDIRPFAERSAARFSQEMGKSIVGISDEAIILLERYSWPGNVRELLNTIERAVLLCDGKVILPRHLLLPGAIGRSMPELVRLAGLSGPADETDPSALGVGAGGYDPSNLPWTPGLGGGMGGAMGGPMGGPMGGGGFGGGAMGGGAMGAAGGRMPLRPATREFFNLQTLEARTIQRALQYCGGNQVRAAELLGIHRNTLRKKIAEYDIMLPDAPTEEAESRD